MPCRRVRGYSSPCGLAFVMILTVASGCNSRPIQSVTENDGDGGGNSDNGNIDSGGHGNNNGKGGSAGSGGTGSGGDAGHDDAGGGALGGAGGNPRGDSADGGHEETRGPVLDAGPAKKQDATVADTAIDALPDARGDCGGPGQPCCGTNTCTNGGCCVLGTCRGNGQMCQSDLATGTCTNGACQQDRTAIACGQAGQPCCGTPSSGFDAICTGASVFCDAGMCIPCGGNGQRCCGSSDYAFGGSLDFAETVCWSGFKCSSAAKTADAKCLPCGGSGQACCPTIVTRVSDAPGSPEVIDNSHLCQAGLGCATTPTSNPAVVNTMCMNCGAIGAACCDGFYGCQPGARCSGRASTSTTGGTCEACGAAGQACCDDGSSSEPGTCTNGLDCIGRQLQVYYSSGGMEFENPDPGKCGMCGEMGQPCCDALPTTPSCRSVGLTCGAGTCVGCGGAGQPCCDGKCNVNLTCGGPRTAPTCMN